MLKKLRKNKEDAVLLNTESIINETMIVEPLKIELVNTVPMKTAPMNTAPAITVKLTAEDLEQINSVHTGTTINVPNVKYACSTHIGTRESQQDYIDAGMGVNGVVFGIVCDGMGGLEGGEAASSTAAQAMAAALINMDPGCDIPVFLAKQALHINKLVHDLPFESEDGNGAGTTIVAAVIVDKNLYWLAIGDSRIYIIRQNEIETVTRDHSYSMELDELVRTGRMTPQDAAADPMRDALISFLGVADLKLIDCNQNPFILDPGDIVLLCSDGLYRSLSEHDIMDVIKRHGDDIEECARVLPLYAYDKSPGGQDNTSVVILKYQHGHSV